MAGISPEPYQPVRNHEEKAFIAFVEAFIEGSSEAPRRTCHSYQLRKSIDSSGNRPCSGLTSILQL